MPDLRYFHEKWVWATQRGGELHPVQRVTENFAPGRECLPQSHSAMQWPATLVQPGRNAEQKRVSVMLPRSQDLQLLPEGVNTTEGFRV